MTIHSEWLRVFKRLASTAHSDTAPQNATTVFIDGQIKLMKQQDTRDWISFYRQQFLWPIKRYFKNGAKCVILAFDNYNLVPRAKQMTQRMRNGKYDTSCAFGAGSDLPSVPPEDWSSYMRNRPFKKKVIYEVITHLTQSSRSMQEDQTLIIDYEDTLYHIHHTSKTSTIPVIRQKMHGEADVKFPDYCKYFKNVLIDAVDGDYVPIALIAREIDPEIRPVIRRIRVRTAETPTHVGQTKREYEYLDINVLYKTLLRFLQTKVPIPDTHRGHEMRIFASLIGCCGSDFTQNMPRITPKTVIENISRAFPGAIMAYDPKNTVSPLDTACFTNKVVSRLYQCIFPKHTEGARGMRSTHCAIQLSTLSAGTKRKIADCDTIESLVRNVNWLLLYWQPRKLVAPDPIQAKYGFVFMTAGGGSVDWAKRIKC
jgi:hypothetical protein